MQRWYIQKNHLNKSHILFWNGLHHNKMLKKVNLLYVRYFLKDIKIFILSRIFHILLHFLDARMLFIKKLIQMVVLLFLRMVFIKIKGWHFIRYYMPSIFIRHFIFNSIKNFSYFISYFRTSKRYSYSFFKWFSCK